MFVLKRVSSARTWCRLSQVIFQHQIECYGARLTAYQKSQADACLVSAAVQKHTSSWTHTPVSKYSSDATQELTELEYEQLADETLDSLTEMFEDLPERLTCCDPEYDITFGSGVLTVKISPSWGTYVINKQTPNKQIWLSSPISGPKRYDYIQGVWIYKHDGQTLHSLLTKEVSEALGEHIDFSQCLYGSR